MRILLVILVVSLTAACGATTPPASPSPGGASVTSSSLPSSTTSEAGEGKTWRRGREPALGYVDGTVLRLPDGSTVPLPRRRGYTSVTRYGDGYLVTDDRTFEGVVGMLRLDRDGRVVDRWASTGPAVPSRDGRLAWVSVRVPESGRAGRTALHVDSVEGGAGRSQELDPSRIPFLTAWFRGKVVYRTWGQRASWMTDLTRPPRRVPLAEDLGAARPDGLMFARVVGAGVEVRRYDGQLVNVVAERGLSRTPGTPLVWEDDQHLLGTLTRDGRQAIARIGIYGRVSLASGWRRSRPHGFAFLAAAPADVERP